MTNMVITRVTIFSDDEELHGALKRVLSATGGIAFAEHKAVIRNKNVVLLYVDSDKQKIEEWIWGRFRKKCLNPLIVIGVARKKEFLKRHPVFEDHPHSHCYVSIPFKLKCLVEKIIELKPLYDSVTRAIIYEHYCQEYEYRLVTHDLKVLSDDKKKTMENLCKVSDFYRAKGDDDIAKYLAEITRKIEREKNDQIWRQVGMDAKKFLEDRLLKR